MNIDPKPMLWATALLTTAALGVGGTAAVWVGRLAAVDLAVMAFGAGLLIGNLVLGAALVQRFTKALTQGEGSLEGLALFGKTVLLFVTFVLVGPLVGMQAFVGGFAVALVAFMTSVVFAPFFQPKLSEAS